MEHREQRLEKKFKFLLNSVPQGLKEYPINLLQESKYQSSKFLLAQISSFDKDRYNAINYIVERLIRLEFIVSEGLFNEAFFMAYQILRICRLLNDFVLVLLIFKIFSKLLSKTDTAQNVKVLNFMADLAQDTNQLTFLIDAQLKIGQQLTQEKEYDKAVRLFLKMLKVSWYKGDTV